MDIETKKGLFVGIMAQVADWRQDAIEQGLIFCYGADDVIHFIDTALPELYTSSISQVVGYFDDWLFSEGYDLFDKDQFKAATKGEHWSDGIVSHGQDTAQWEYWRLCAKICGQHIANSQPPSQWAWLLDRYIDDDYNGYKFEPDGETQTSAQLPATNDRYSVPFKAPNGDGKSAGTIVKATNHTPKLRKVSNKPRKQSRQRSTRVRKWVDKSVCS